MFASTAFEPAPVFNTVVETDRYLKVSARIDVDDIDWEAARKAGLTDDEKFILTYFTDIEGQTIMYLRDLLATEAAKEQDVIAFLTMWNYEEFFHGQVLARLLAECGAPLGTNRIAKVHAGRRFTEALEAFAAGILSRIFRKEFPAVHAAWGATQEITTLHGYEELGRNTKNPVLKTLCERIAKQERRHFAWYFNSARVRLSASPRAQRLTRFLLQRFWTPVGAGVKPAAEVTRLIRLLFVEGRALRVGGDIDAKIGALPGLSGIGLMAPYMRRAKIGSQTKPAND